MSHDDELWPTPTSHKLWRHISYDDTVCLPRPLCENANKVCFKRSSISPLIPSKTDIVSMWVMQFRHAMWMAVTSLLLWRHSESLETLRGHGSHGKFLHWGQGHFCSVNNVWSLTKQKWLLLTYKAIMTTCDAFISFTFVKFPCWVGVHNDWSMFWNELSPQLLRIHATTFAAC